MTAVDRQMDQALADWAERFGLEVVRRADDRMTEFTISRQGVDRRVVVGHADSVHIWLVVDGMWRADSHGDDLESLMFDWSQFLSLADGLLSRRMDPPSSVGKDSREKWYVPELRLILRSLPETAGSWWQRRRGRER